MIMYLCNITYMKYCTVYTTGRCLFSLTPLVEDFPGTAWAIVGPSMRLEDTHVCTGFLLKKES